MYSYEINMVDPESARTIILTHKNKFTKNQLVQYYISCMQKAYIEARNSKVYEPSDDISINMIHDETIKNMINDLKFERLISTAGMNLWSLDDDDKDDETLYTYQRGADNPIKRELISLRRKYEEHLSIGIKG